VIAGSSKQARFSFAEVFGEDEHGERHAPRVREVAFLETPHEHGQRNAGFEQPNQDDCQPLATSENWLARGPGRAIDADACRATSVPALPMAMPI
jgi:hypothetical protein